MNGTEARIVRLLQDRGAQTSRTIAGQLMQPMPSIRRTLVAMVRRDLINVRESVVGRGYVYTAKAEAPTSGQDLRT